MRDHAIREPNDIALILTRSARLRFVLGESYGVDLGGITAMRVDGDNLELDVWSGEAMWRFLDKGLRGVLALDPRTGLEELHADPALAQTIHALVAEFTG